MKAKMFLASLMAGIFIAGNALATLIEVDGIFHTSEYTSFFAEDQTGGAGTYLGPGYGGQDYDIEYLGLYVDEGAGRLYFGLQTGVDLNPPRASGTSQIGHLALDLGNDGVYEYGVQFWDNFTLWKAQDGWTNVYYAQHSEAGPWRVINNGSNSYQTPAGDYGVAFGTDTDGHGNRTNVVEGWLLLDDLGLNGFNDDITANITMYCGNDYGNTTVSPSPVPEPATMILLGAGLMGFAGLKRKRLFDR